MKTVIHSGGKTSSAMTYVGREVPVIKAFPALNGVAKAVRLKTSLHTDSGSSLNIYCPVYLFKTFGGDPSYWEARTDNMYQYPGDKNHWLKEAYIGDVLAGGTLSATIKNGEITLDMSLTEYGKRLANWAGDVYLAVLTDETHLYWSEAITSEITVEYNSGIVKLNAGGKIVNCEVYMAEGGAFKQKQPYFAKDGRYREAGE